MGTNFYHIKLGTWPCLLCGHTEPPEKLHIGKSSAGWCFALHVIPEKGLNLLSDWESLFNSNAGRIEDEYGTPIEPGEMMEIITKRRSDREWGEGRWWNYSILGRPSPYESEADFHDKNNSLRGPNGLLRRRIGWYCIGHGEGTWDLVRGDFF
ncbi:MAG: hypothetical protein V2I26_08975 [Halieaceae bacterium]|jgi:hypothetical protein|nr:hypothetical protein [Halieaceae bacterium]